MTAASGLSMLLLALLCHISKLGCCKMALWYGVHAILHFCVVEEQHHV